MFQRKDKRPNTQQENPPSYVEGNILYEESEFHGGRHNFRYLTTQILYNFEVTSEAHCLLKCPDFACGTCMLTKLMVSLHLSGAFSSCSLQRLCSTDRLSLTQFKHAQQLSFKLFFLVLVTAKELFDIFKGYRFVHGTSRMLAPILKSWSPDTFNDFGDVKA